MNKFFVTGLLMALTTSSVFANCATGKVKNVFTVKNDRGSAVVDKRESDTFVYDLDSGSRYHIPLKSGLQDEIQRQMVVAALAGDLTLSVCAEGKTKMTYGAGAPDSVRSYSVSAAR